MTNIQKINLFLFRTKIFELNEISDELIKNILVNKKDIDYVLLLDDISFNECYTINDKDKIFKYIEKILIQLQQLIPYKISTLEQDFILKYIILNWQIIISEINNIMSPDFVELFSLDFDSNTACWFLQNKLIYKWFSLTGSIELYTNNNLNFILNILKKQQTNLEEYRKYQRIINNYLKVGEEV